MRKMCTLYTVLMNLILLSFLLAYFIGSSCLFCKKENRLLKILRPKYYIELLLMPKYYSIYHLYYKTERVFLEVNNRIARVLVDVNNRITD